MSPRERRVLFLHRTYGHRQWRWWPVGGTPRPGETGIQTARRELFEETGLTPEKLLPLGLAIPHAQAGRRHETFVAPVPEASEVRLNHEHDDYRWLTGDEAIAMVPPGSRVYLEHLRDNFINPDQAGTLCGV